MSLSELDYHDGQIVAKISSKPLQNSLYNVFQKARTSLLYHSAKVSNQDNGWFCSYIYSLNEHGKIVTDRQIDRWMDGQTDR